MTTKKAKNGAKSTSKKKGAVARGKKTGGAKANVLRKAKPSSKKK